MNNQSLTTAFLKKKKRKKSHHWPLPLSIVTKVLFSIQLSTPKKLHLRTWGTNVYEFVSFSIIWATDDYVLGGKINTTNYMITTRILKNQKRMPRYMGPCFLYPCVNSSFGVPLPYYPCYLPILVFGGGGGVWGVEDSLEINHQSKTRIC